jgi:hypothetical protein
MMAPRELLTQRPGLLRGAGGFERVHAALTSAQKELDIARIQKGEASGALTPEQAGEARAAVEKKYLEKAQADKEHDEHQDLSRKTTAMLQLDANQTDLDKRHQQAVDAATAATAHQASVMVNEVDQNKKIADAQADLDKKQADFDKYTKNVTPHMLDRDPALRSDVGGRRADVDAARAKVAELQGQLETSRDAKWGKGPTEIKRLEDAAAEADKRATENKTERANSLLKNDFCLKLFSGSNV